MANYRKLDELIRDGMELKLECRRCHHTERSDPADAKDYVASCRKYNAPLGITAEPDFTIERCANGLPCPICGVCDFNVDVIKKRKCAATDHEE